MFAAWQRAIWGAAWAAAAVILLSLAVFKAEKHSASSPYDLSPAFQVVAASFVP